MQLNYIANASVPSTSGKTIPVIDPSDGQVFDEIQRSNAHDIDTAVQSARECLELVWSRFSAAERGRLLMRLSAKIAEHAEELAMIEQRDCGKPTKQARADAAALARYFEFYAGACDKLHGDTIPYLDGYSVMTWREPHGVTGHVIPWNYPMQIFGRSVGGALAAGNVCVVKPAEDACLSLIRVAQLAAEVGFPAGAINIVTGYGHEVGDALARHKGIDHISFTGSPTVGTLIQQVAAERHCPVTLELGGKSPQIVFADADLDMAIPAIINAIVQNAGQTCSAGSRLLVEQAIYEPLLLRLGEAFENLRVGPAAMDLDVGPLIRQSQQQRVWDFPKRRARRQHRHGGPGPDRRRSARDRVLPGPHPAARRAGHAPAGAGRSLRPGAVRDELQGRRPRRRTGQRHAVRPGRRHLDARRRAPVPHGQSASKAARCSSTTTAPAAASSCRSAA
jgi:aldehyde dehydrogenase (NAD+)